MEYYSIFKLDVCNEALQFYMVLSTLIVSFHLNFISLEVFLKYHARCRQSMRIIIIIIFFNHSALAAFFGLVNFSSSRIAILYF